MFVSIACDFSSDDNKSEIQSLLRQYGFSRIMDNLFESPNISETGLQRLKKDIDRVTDSYDSIRMYQYPMEGTLIVTSLKEKKWRRIKMMV